MPELPEVESIRLYLREHLVGKTLQRVEILEKKMFIGNPHDIIHAEVIDILRSGKILILQFQKDNTGELKTPKQFVSIHLKLSGQILYAPDKDLAVFANPIPRADSNKMPGKTTRIILYFFG